jgi:Asp-tRNA(Asn)/Glu-tRNA(Gln) amidotransferase A subunit family amidase
MFDGVPIGIKDEYDIKGYSTCSGRKAHDVLFPSKEESGWLVQLWQEAGGIILGKLHMHQVGADTNGNNPTWGTPVNPHNSLYYTGGSSSGAAYAVASGLIPVALGTDGGGSIRIPSSFCGLYGLKPSHNRLDNTGSTMTVNGPIAATMSDLMATYRLFTKPNPADPICSAFTNPPPPKTRKIGYPRVWFSQSDASVLEHCNNAVDYFQKLGYELIDVEIPLLPEGQLAQAYSILTEMSFTAKQNPVPNSNYLTAINPAEKILLATGAQTSAYDYLLAQSLRNLLMQHLAFLYQQHPGLIILTPTTPMAGWPINNPGDLTHGVSDANTSLRNMTYVWLANFCGNPAISVPVGYVDPVKGKGKIPIGLMAMGEWGAEEQLLQWGSEAETYLNDVYGGRIRAENWEDVVKAAKSTK